MTLRPYRGGILPYHVGDRLHPRRLVLNQAPWWRIWRWLTGPRRPHPAAVMDRGVHCYTGVL